jgi:hypothetical protein
MSEAARHVRIKLRNVVLAEGAELTEQRDLVFVELADPPPVRTLLAVEDGSDEPAALEVARVVEVPDAERTRRGFYGRFVESSALERFARVGTEHLAAGYMEGEEPEPASAPAADDESTVQMAVPAPVVDPDPSEPIDLREVQTLEMGGLGFSANDDEDEADETEADDGDASDPDDAAEASDEASEPADSTPTSGRRRRGRKRR